MASRMVAFSSAANRFGRSPVFSKALMSSTKDSSFAYRNDFVIKKNGISYIEK